MSGARLISTEYVKTRRTIVLFICRLLHRLKLYFIAIYCRSKKSYNFTYDSFISGLRYSCPIAESVCSIFVCVCVCVVSLMSLISFYFHCSLLDTSLSNIVKYDVNTDGASFFSFNWLSFFYIFSYLLFCKA